MRRLTTLVCLLLLFNSAEADEKPRPPQTPEQAAEAVMDAAQAKDASALQALAQKDAPDPWLVVEALLDQGHHDAANAFAEATSGKAVEQLSAYVSARRGSQQTEAASRVLRMFEALAAKDWQRMLEIAPSGEAASLDTVSKIQLASGRGRALAALKRVDESRAVHLSAGKAAEALGWYVRASASFRQAGMEAYRASRLADAVAPWQEWVRVAELLGDQKRLARALNSLGVVLIRGRRLEDARHAFERALDLPAASRPDATRARLLNNLALLEDELGNLRRSVERLDQAHRIWSDLGEKLGAAETLANSATTLGKLGSHAEARVRFARAIKAMRALGNQAREARFLRNLAEVDRAVGAFEDAIENLRRAIALAEATSDAETEQLAKHSLAAAYFAFGRFADSLRMHEASLAMARAQKNRAAEGFSLIGRGSVRMMTGDHPGAFQDFREALRIFRALRHPFGTAAVLTNLGLYYSELGEIEEALRSHEEALTIQRRLSDGRGECASLLNLALAHTNRGSAAQALPRWREALAAAREHDNNDAKVRALLGIAKLLAAGRKFDESLEALHEAAASTEAFGSYSLQALLGRMYARVYLSRGEPELAGPWARKSVEAAARKSGGLADSQGAATRDRLELSFSYGCLAALRTGQNAELHWFLEQGRATSLRERMGSRAALEAVALPAELRRGLIAVRSAESEALATYKARRGSSRKERASAHRAWKAARAASVRFAQRVEREAKRGADLTVSATIELDALRPHLRADQALIYYAVTVAEGIALVVRRDGVRRVALAPSARILEAAEALIEDPDALTPERLTALQQLIVDPLQLSDDVKQILVSPVGSLGYVPFSLLFSRGEVAYVPSGTAYAMLADEQGPRGRKVLGLGDPTYTEARATGGRLSPLPGTRKEVEAIADVALLGGAATEARLQEALGKQARWRAVHLACHGLVDPDQPMLSALALTPDANDEDGMLTALETLGLKCPADLVVLSACDTAKGRVYMTEGIVGLTRAFMFAGAPRVICSLWKVDDDATQALMIKFYELWNPKDGKPGLGAAAALKGAQQYVRSHEKWKRPYFWAAWVLWGLPD